MCASLDSFQGQERPIIIYSSTRSTNYKGVDKPRVGFMKELRRLNVAFTRCQKQLVIIGDINYLTSCEYQELNEETREPLANKSEKKYSEFISKIVEQAKTSQGEYVDYSKLDQMLGGEE
jgi:superfamily I DNA and/or RNA helicase